LRSTRTRVEHHAAAAIRGTNFRSPQRLERVHDRNCIAVALK
jgi:hypothetical protein